MRSASALVTMLALCVGGVQAQQARSILFIGNSFTYGSGSAVRYYRANTVTDLNDEGIGGVPALFKALSDPSGLAYDVYLEARGGSNFDFPPWHGQSIAAMALDVRAGYDQLAAVAPGAKSVSPVGEAWTRAMDTGVADPNPYDGIDADKLDLWTYDHYHASTAGYYLEALVVFSNVTGVDPRALGAGECSGMELGLSSAEVRALQQVAADELAASSGIATSQPAGATPPTRASRCAAT